MPVSEQVMIGLVSSHKLVASYLRDLVIQAGIDSNPQILSESAATLGAFPKDGRGVLVFDLQTLTLPLSTCLEASSRAGACNSFLALDQPRKTADVAHLLLSGFSGFLSHAEVPQSLPAAIRAVARGETWTTPEAMRIYMELTSRKTSRNLEILTRREDQILELLQKRYSNKEIAEFLGISESTVKFHVANVMSKLRISARRDVADLPSLRKATAFY